MRIAGRVATHRGPGRPVPAATGVSGLWISVADVSLPYNQLAPRETRRGPARTHPALPRAAFAPPYPGCDIRLSGRGCPSADLYRRQGREGWMWMNGWMDEWMDVHGR